MTGPVQTLAPQQIFDDFLSSISPSTPETEDTLFETMGLEAQAIWIVMKRQARIQEAMQKKMGLMKAEEEKIKAVHDLTDVILKTKASNGSWTKPSTEPILQLVEKINGLSGTIPLINPDKELFTPEETQQLLSQLDTLADRHLKKGEELQLETKKLQDEISIMWELIKSLQEKISDSIRAIIRRIAGSNG